MSVVSKMSDERKRELADLLVGYLLKAKGGSKVTTELATDFLYLWREERLETDEGIELMLRMAATMDPEGIKAKLSEKGFSDVAEALG